MLLASPNLRLFASYFSKIFLISGKKGSILNTLRLRFSSKSCVRKKFTTPRRQQQTFLREGYRISRSHLRRKTGIDRKKGFRWERIGNPPHDPGCRGPGYARLPTLRDAPAGRWGRVASCCHRGLCGMSGFPPVRPFPRAKRRKRLRTIFSDASMCLQ